MPKFNFDNISVCFVLPLALVLLTSITYSQPRSRGSAGRDDSVVITARSVVILRSGKLVKDFPGKRRARIKYPIVSGLSNAAVLRRLRAILEVKNVFDSSIAEYRQDNWLEEFGYEVAYNDRYILDITFRQEGSGAYPDTQTKHFAINLKNGRVIKISDAFVPDKIHSLFELVKTKFQAELEQMLIDLRDSKSDPEDVRIAKEAQDALEFRLSDLDNFSITEKGVTFLYDAGYPHVIQAFEPEGRYFFSYAELKPFIRRVGPLGQFIR